MDGQPPPPAEAPHADRSPDDQPPPVLGSWRALYALVIGELLLVIAFCGWLAGRGR